MTSPNASGTVQADLAAAAAATIAAPQQPQQQPQTASGPAGFDAVFRADPWAGYGGQNYQTTGTGGSAYPPHPVPNYVPNVGMGGFAAGAPLPPPQTAQQGYAPPPMVMGDRPEVMHHLMAMQAQIQAMMQGHAQNQGTASQQSAPFAATAPAYAGHIPQKQFEKLVGPPPPNRLWDWSSYRENDRDSKVTIPKWDGKNPAKHLKPWLKRLRVWRRETTSMVSCWLVPVSRDHGWKRWLTGFQRRCW